MVVVDGGQMIREPMKNLYRSSRYEITQCGFDFFFPFFYSGVGEKRVWCGWEMIRLSGEAVYLATQERWK